MVAQPTGRATLTREQPSTLLMLVVISISRQNGSIGISVSKPQHNSTFTQTYASGKEARAVLLAVGIELWCGDNQDEDLIALSETTND
jgi:hypothetical protein